METRANYVLIGIFALLGFLGVLGFFLAFGKFQLDRQFAYYDVRFDAVSGLSRAADVRFAGLLVGQVVDVRLSPDGDGTVLVRLEVDRDTPVRADSVATVDSSGITGVSFVAISTGTQAAPLINDRTDIPELEAGRSTIQSLTEGAPRILAETLEVLEQVNRLLGEENQTKVSNILTNVESSTGELSRALDNFSGFTDTIAEATETFAEFSNNLEPILLQAEKTVESLQFAIDEFALLATESRITFETGTATLQTVETFVETDLDAMVTDLRSAADLVGREIEAFSREAQTMFGEFSRTGAAATQRIEALDPALARLEPLLARADTTFETVERMAGNVDTLVSGDGAALVAEAREMVALARDAAASVATVAENDLPVIMDDVRAATADIRQVVNTVGEDLSQVSGRVEELSAGGLRTLDQVTETFANANTTLGAINRALETSEGAIQAAERAFIGADRVINEEVGQITEDLRDVLGRLGRAVDSVSEDIPEVTADLRRTAESAARAFDDLGRLVRESSGPVRDFTTSGLPNITQLARETRGLITNLDRLTRQIERDPARFLLNRQTPEFRR
ncbi:MlaD family protein [Roseinatronobacter bogoriensis]|uniref:MCE family protein n=1 Tax=Roseinatronobacter bogoriensis subsp. barguzinensis TaxID=441209 RepID=A0A2K8K966_9RHOB|nr:MULTISPECIES: MlaD family protein [Rhodobaca]ATX65989.1 MCE family protein [Rhodobaca barguzinensis]MBB4208015.1 phospholipid/cholesterol/gamma-HCH transport system substrate-binding protein [Rhodobaca bogoriensis DSM 18756]TDW38654.1 phospholipid/cholesterol/gamma-HCH transport system substrate-binding protein [Rhodobaca barguzinensis]TDY69307.1 phospholipid/cholesterol/gamma-HCH transport system substrate-binding protein [Rhodobaca bogoriensis DSM 18756]